MGLHGAHQATRNANFPALPESVREHLGRKLRAQYYVIGERPAYLGDPVTPLSLDPLIARMERIERARRKARISRAGLRAVSSALGA